MNRRISPLLACGLLASLPVDLPAVSSGNGEQGPDFDIRSVRSGRWSDPRTWRPVRLPRQGERVLVARDTAVEYDVASRSVLRLVQVAGRLHFARDRDTLLEAGLITVLNSEECSEHGFSCDFAGADATRRDRSVAALEIGTVARPIPAGHSARIRLHHVTGMDPKDAPALVCCSARLEIHGAPMSRTWVELGAAVDPGASRVLLDQAVTGWRVGDEILVTGSERGRRRRSFRAAGGEVTTELRRITGIDGREIRLDRPLEHPHRGSGRYRSEVANLSRNVIVESADPDGVRGHTIYHRFSRGGISHARFAHLGKEGVLGRYAIHFHLVGDTMRGAAVVGAAIVDSHNRWVTIHGTQYLVVRDCVGYRSVGHGFFLEDGTEVYNLLDRNLAVHAYRGRRLPRQVMPFDPNDGAGFWWANGRNGFVRNVSCENDEYGYRYDSQRRSNFDSRLPIRQADGEDRVVDIRTIPIWLFRDNEAHTEGLYGFAIAGTDGAGPDTHHPHRLRGLTIWEVHYALRAQVPTMQVEDVDIQDAAYGIYRPWFQDHVYRNLRIGDTSAEPFNRGLDDRSTQHGKITVDGLTFAGKGYGRSMPLIQISANNASGDAASHFRNVLVEDRRREPRPLVNLGGGPRLDPETERSVPVFLHDWYGAGRHAEIVSTRARDVRSSLGLYRREPPLTGDESRVREVRDVEFPKLLQPVDDSPPVTVVLAVSHSRDATRLRGVAYDDGEVARVEVGGRPARILSRASGVVDWEVTLPSSRTGRILARSSDTAGNVERTPHRVDLAAGR